MKYTNNDGIKIEQLKEKNEKRLDRIEKVWYIISR